MLDSRVRRLLMKTILVVIVAVVLVILGVVGTGSLLPKRHVVSRTASYRAAPDRLFFLISGPQGWRPDVLRCEAVPDAGSRELLRETTRDGETITYELLDRVYPVSIKRRIATENLPYSGTWTYSLQPKGDVTIVRITEDGEVYNPVFRIMARFGHKRSLDGYLRALGQATQQEVRIGD